MIPSQHRRRSPFAALALLAGVAVGAPARADTAAELETLKRQMQQLIEQNAEQQQQIQQLQQRLERVAAPTAAVPAAAAAPTPNAEQAIDRALAEVRPPTDVADPAGLGAASARPSLLSTRIGGAELRLIDVSFDILTAAGSSTVGGQTLRDLQGGAHDPNRRGFTLQQGELSLAGAVDPYFFGEAHVIFTDSSVELEEAFVVTTALPWDLQVKGGYFLTDFGRINPTHAHAWTYLDQPFVITRLLGSEGLRSPGVEVSWLAPLPWFSQLSVGMQDADEGELTPSFLDADGGIGGRPAVTDTVSNLSDFLYLARWANAWDLSSELSALVGVSGLYGANSTGADASTYIYGTDLTFKWRPLQNFRGWPFVVWQSEVLSRAYTADPFVASSAAGEVAAGGAPAHGDGGTDEPGEFPNDLPGDILRDAGFYSQVLWGFAHPWAAALRLEYASGHGQSVEDGELVSRRNDPFRADRWRLSPLLVYQPSEFSRIRLQYNYDNTPFLPGDPSANSVWLGVEVLYGSHPAHKY